MKDLYKKSIDELKNDLYSKKIALRDIRFNSSGTKVKNIKNQKNIKKDIARIETVLNNKND